MRSLLTFLIAGLMPMGAAAVTLIESTAEGEVSRFWVEGVRARIESRDQQGYMLMDLGKGTMLLVNHEDKQVVDMSRQLQRADGKKAGPAIKLVKKGNGPRIAGYDTQHYQLTADGQVCQDLYMSRKAYQDAKLEAYAKAFAKYVMVPPVVLGPCDQAGLSVDRHLAEGGLPLRVVEEGEVMDEVTRITPNAALPAGGFEPPAGYERVDMDVLMQEGMREMEEQMRRMQEGMTPEQRREMERMMQEFMPRGE
ncbi:MAG: DUF4412 domain-containing protein [Thiohalomonadaceae bacterium]